MLSLDWRRLVTIVPGGARTLILLTGVSFVFAVVEAAVLVLVVLAGLGVTEDSGSVDVPIVGSSISPGTALVIAGIAAVASLGGHLYTARLSARISSSVGYVLRERVIAAFNGATWARQSRDREGTLQETVTTQAQQGAMMALNFAALLVAGSSLIALFATAFVVDPVVTVVVMLSGAVLFILLRPLTKLSRHNASTWLGRNLRFAEIIASWTSMAMDLRVFGVEQVKARELQETNREAERAMYQTRLAFRIGSSLYKDLALIFLVGAVAALYALSSIDLAAVGSVVLLVVRSLNYAQQAQSALQTANELSPALERILAHIEVLESEPEQSGSQPLAEIGVVHLRGVGYDYEPDRPGLRGIDLELAPGEALGVIGPSGGGKSTLVQVLLRLRRPTTGTVTVGGVPYEELDAEDWHRRVSLVPQEPRLVEGSVVDNIAFLRADITREQVERAAADAHVLDDILRLPDGLDTELGARGAGLSGGQKQRVAIARALVGRPQLLVLDEPTSALDQRSEELLRETIEDLRGQVTLVIVAHRLSTLRSCDRILVIEDGGIERIGPAAEVLATAPFLRDLQQRERRHDHGSRPQETHHQPQG